LKQSLVQIFVSAVFLGIGARWGVEGVLIAYLLRGTLVSWYNIHAMNRSVQLRPMSVIRMLGPPSIACGVMVGIVWLAKYQLSDAYSGIHLLALLVFIGAITYGAALLAGDAVGLWKGYVGSAVRSLAGAFPKPRSAETGKAA
jgi:hypothetical protein